MSACDPGLGTGDGGAALSEPQKAMRQHSAKAAAKLTLWKFGFPSEIESISIGRAFQLAFGFLLPLTAHQADHKLDALLRLAQSRSTFCKKGFGPARMPSKEKSR